MIKNIIQVFPFPLFYGSEMHSGSSHKWPDRCLSCKHQMCRSVDGDALQECSYGYNYIRIAKGVVMAGVLVKDEPAKTSAKQKNQKREFHSVITNEILSLAITRIRSALGSIGQVEQEVRRKITQNYIEKNQYKSDFLKDLQAEIKKGLSFVHDYKQINVQISQNINVILETKYGTGEMEAKLYRATDAERAIYYSSKYLEEKLAVAKFLMNPEGVDRSRDHPPTRFHGLVHKYYKIYEPRFRSKSVSIRLAGESYANIVVNPSMVGVIPHTLIDNAAKYSPRQAWVEIAVHDNHDARNISFAVTSFGPKILAEEKTKIFQPFYRGIHAERIEEEGAGYGLYVAQMIAKEHLGTEITVSQSEQRDLTHDGFLTTFSVFIPISSRP